MRVHSNLREECMVNLEVFKELKGDPVARGSEQKGDCHEMRLEN